MKFDAKNGAGLEFLKILCQNKKSKLCSPVKFLVKARRRVVGDWEKWIKKRKSKQSARKMSSGGDDFP